MNLSINSRVNGDLKEVNVHNTYRFVPVAREPVNLVSDQILQVYDAMVGSHSAYRKNTCTKRR